MPIYMPHRNCKGIKCGDAPCVKVHDDMVSLGRGYGCCY